MVFSRAQVIGMVVENDEDAHEPEEVPDPLLPDQDGVYRDLAQVPSELDEQSIGAMQEQLYSFNLNVLADNPAEGAQFHTVLSEDRMRLRERTWSDYLLYGTAPSNQVSLILDRLHSVVHVHYDGKMG